MDEQEKKPGEFSLEDILKEFGDDSQIPTSDESLEDILIWGQESTRPTPKGSQPQQDTVRLDEITRAVRSQRGATQDTVAFTPVGEQEEAFVPPVPAEPQVEPYSDEWEPEYEEPMGEYVPPQPIMFRPKSRLGELKRKLIAGPEKRYYELSEQGMGKLQLALLGSLLVAILAISTTVLSGLGLLGEDRLKFVVFCQFLSLLLSALLGSYQLMEGFGDLVRKRFSLNSLLIFSLIACLADAILCLGQLRVPCSAAFCLNMTMSLWSTYQKRNTELGQMDTMRKAIRLDSVVSVPDYHEGRPGFLRGEGQVEDFMDHYQDASGTEKTMNVYALVVLSVSVVIGIAAGVMHSITLGLRAASAVLLLAVPCTSYIALSRPAAVLERRLHHLGAVICGWRGVKGLSSPGFFPLSDEDLFPSGSVKLNGVKFYGSRSSDEVVAYAAALMEACGGVMAPLFTQLLESRNGYHYEANGLRRYPGGVGAEVDGEAVLAGSLTFMQEMGVELPQGTRVSQAVYVAIDGTLCGLFAVAYQKVKLSAVGLHTLCAYRRLTPVITAADFMLTESFLRNKFGCNTRRMAFPEQKIRTELAEKTVGEGNPALALTTREGLAGAAYAVTGARALRSASIAGVVVHMLGGILGLVMMLLLGLLGAEYLLTPMNFLLYELLWMIPGLLITEWTRSI